MTIRRFSILILVSAAFIPGIYANGQTMPLDVHFSYETQNLAPRDYLVRVAAPFTPNTTARISATLLATGGNGTLGIVNPATYEFRWYFNDAFVAAGKGLTAVDVTLPTVAGASSAVRLRVADGRGALAADGTFTLPLSRPHVTIVRMTDGGESFVHTAALSVPPNSSVTVRAKPYFFSAEALTRLSFAWTLNGEPIIGSTDDPAVLRITAPAAIGGAEYSFSVAVTNADNPREIVEEPFALRIQ